MTAPLSAFLAVWLPRIRGDERAVVLALCNPHEALIRGPAASAGAPLHYALGDVESWLDPDDGVVPPSGGRPLAPRRPDRRRGQ